MTILHPAIIEDNIATIPLLDGSNISIPLNPTIHDNDANAQLSWTIKDGIAHLDGTRYWTWPKNLLPE
jgi:hypothetical protein